jgi:hypothetical protein
MKPQQTPESSQGQQQECEREERRDGTAAMVLRRYAMGMEDSRLLSFPSFSNSLLQPQMPICRVSARGDDILMQRPQLMQTVLDVIDSVFEILDEGNNTSMLLLDDEKHSTDHRALE